MPAAHQSGVPVFSVLGTPSVAPLRVLGRCILTTAPEEQQPVLFGSFASSLDDSDDENLTSGWAAAQAAFPRPAAVGVRPTETYVRRAPRTQLERPPRV